MTQKKAQADTRRPGRKLALQWGGGAPQHPVGGRPLRAMKNHSGFLGLLLEQAHGGLVDHGKIFGAEDKLAGLEAVIWRARGLRNHDIRTCAIVFHADVCHGLAEDRGIAHAVDGNGDWRHGDVAGHGSGRRFGNRTPFQVLMQPAQPLIPRVGNLPAHELADPRMADVQFLGNRHPLAAPLLKQCANFFV